MAAVACSAAGGCRRAWRAPRAWLTLIIITAIGLAADLGTKSWSFATVGVLPVELDRAALVADPDYHPPGLHATQEVLPYGMLDFRLVLNPGAVFGIGAGHRWFFVVFTFGAIAAGMIVFGRRTHGGDVLAHISLGLVIAGGVGNLYDRVMFGRVRDFVQAMPGRRLPFDWAWPGTNNQELFPWVFNIADVLLFVGMIGILVFLNRTRDRPAPSDLALSLEDGGALPEPE